MGRRARSEIARQIQGQSWDGAVGLLAAALIAAVLALAISASSALAVTGAPELIAPTASSAHSSPLSIEYNCPKPDRRRRSPLSRASARPSSSRSLPLRRQPESITSSSSSARSKSETANVAKASARTLTLECKAGKPTEVTASFKLSTAAKQLVAKHGASAKLAVRAYALASAGGKPLASATLPGRA